MSKKTVFSNPAFALPSVPTSHGFHMIPQTNTFNSVFNPKPLDQKDSEAIETLLVENFLQGRVEKDQVPDDLKKLKILTAEIKAIVKQGAILAGERVHQARAILKPYRDGAFAQWIDITFGSRKTAFNLLGYYELYNNLPSEDTKEKFQKLPQKIAYLLASKSANINDKIDVIEKHFDSNTAELMTLIQEKFPANEGDGRKKIANKTLLDTLEFGLKKLLKRKDQLSEENVRHVIKLKALIDEILA